MAVSEIDDMTRMEAADIEAEIRQKHQPKLHNGEPCPVHVCCTCGKPGCPTGATLGLLNMERAALAAAQAEIAALREHLTYAKYTLEGVQPEVGYDCECEDCDECGLEVAECSKIECSKTCNCSLCRPCIVQDAIDGFSALLAHAAGAERTGEGVSDADA